MAFFSQAPSLTAYIVARLIFALHQHRGWSFLLAPKMGELSGCFVSFCKRYGPVFWLLAILPSPLLIFLLDRFLFKGMPQHYALRKAAIEQWVREKIAAGAAQVIVLGGGFDTLSLRLSNEYPAVSFIEVDHPVTQAVKQEALRRKGFCPPSNCHFTACDFSHFRFDEVLRSHPGFNPLLKTLYVAEGVTMYLTEQENIALFSSIVDLSAPGTEMMFTAIERGAASDQNENDTIIRRFLKLKKESYKWGIALRDVDGFLRQFGGRLVKTLRYSQLQERIRTVSEGDAHAMRSGEHLHFVAF